MDEKAVSAYVTNNYDAIARKYLSGVGPFSLQPQQALDFGGNADFAIFDDSSGEVVGLIECKGEPSLTEFVRGLGQTTQYYHAIKRKCMNFSKKAKTLYIMGSAVVKKIDHWDKFHFDESHYLVLIDDAKCGVFPDPTEGYALNKKKDIDKLISKATDDCLYHDIPFVRDIRVYEVYMGMMAIYQERKNDALGVGGGSNRPAIENVLQNYNTTNSGNARNVAILINNLNFADSNGKLTHVGSKMIENKYVNFVKEFIFDYYNVVIVNIVTAIQNLASRKGVDWKNIEVTQKEIKEEILAMYDGKKIGNLTNDSRQKSNYIGTCMLILEEELGAVESIKNGASKKYKFKYLPLRELTLVPDVINEEIEKRVPTQLVNYMNTLGYNPADWIK